MTALVRRPARDAAIARQQEQIDQNVAKIEEAKRRPPTAIDALAGRLGVSVSNLSSTLKQTVFKGASDAEFVSLVVVANAYGLNPLTKEIYAFPQKGGGIVPLVSIDGWIRIMNDHPQFDGIEHKDIATPDGELLAIEAIIYRKDRTHPIRVTEYLDECKRNTEPWNKSPARMLRHRATIQCARYAFGFSGIYTDDDAEVIQNGPAVAARNITPVPTRAETALIEHDPETGEIVDTVTDDNPDAQEGPADEQRGEAVYDEQTGAEIDPREAVADDIVAAIKAAGNIIDLRNVKAERQNDIDALPEEMAGVVARTYRDAEKRLKGGAK